MKKTTRFVMPLAAVAILASSSVMTLAQQTQSPATAQYNGSFAGSPEQEQAYKDGMEAAKLDTLARRKIDPTSSHLYKNPPARVKKDQRDAYRSAFTSGYNKAINDAKANGGF
ncbi:MAG: hypothetical protein HOQ35_19205 [Acidobacteriaceae bacterium]|nr:hypothetical protein [Acidobacteriaceae bacterium]